MTFSRIKFYLTHFRMFLFGSKTSHSIDELIQELENYDGKIYACVGEECRDNDINAAELIMIIHSNISKYPLTLYNGQKSVLRFCDAPTTPTYLFSKALSRDYHICDVV